MKRSLSLLLALVLAFALAPTLSLAQTDRVDWKVSAPAAPTKVSASSSGNFTYYYWIVANYAGGGVSISPPFRVNGPAAITSIPISWGAVTGTGVTYDVLRTTTPTIRYPCTCSVATGLAVTTTTDTGGALGLYTLSGMTFHDATASMVLNNRDYASPNLVVTLPTGGALNIRGGLTTSGNQSLTGNLSVGGNLNLAGNLSVTGTSAFTGSVAGFSSIWSRYQAINPILTNHYFSRGTVAAPTIVGNGDIVSQTNFYAHDGVAYQPLAQTRAYVDAAPGAGNIPGGMVLSTTQNGSVVMRDRLYLNSVGDVYLGNLGPGPVAGYGTVWNQANSVNPAGFGFRQSQGTYSVPLVVLNGDNLGFLRWTAYDGAAYQPSAEIKAIVDAAPGAGDTPGALIFSTTPDGTAATVERAKIAATGDLSLGAIQAASTGTSAIWQEAHGAGVVPTLNTHVSRGTSTVPVIVNNLDLLGDTVWYGYDGAAYQPAASIKAIVDAAPGAGDMPGALVFSTTLDGTVAPLERVKISNNGTFCAGAATAFCVSNSGVPTKSNNLTLDGLGNPLLMAHYTQTGGTVTVVAGDLLTTPGAGTYRVTVYDQTTTVAGGACTLTATIGWTYNAVAATADVDAARDLTIANGHGQGSVVFRLDAATSITRTITIAGVGCGLQVWDMYMTAERIN